MSSRKERLPAAGLPNFVVRPPELLSLDLKPCARGPPRGEGYEGSEGAREWGGGSKKK